MSDDEQSPEGLASFQMRACEHCRQRKIKCDRKAPCASCRSLQIECKPSARVPASRSRTSSQPVSGQGDRQMYLINQRLAAIEDSLKKLALHRNNSLSPRMPEQSPGSNIEDSPTGPVPTFEGESSFEVQTLQAQEAANRTISQVFGNADTAQLKVAISSLVSSLDAHNTDSRGYQAFLSSNECVAAPETLTLPPVELTSAVVKRMRSHPPMSLAIMSSRIFDFVESLCQKCYFPSASLPTGSRALLFGVMFFTIRDYLNDPLSGFTAEQLTPSLELCEQNFYRSVETYTTLTVPTLENTLVLMFAAMRAQEESKLHLVWTYVSAAATMCFSLGFHRRSSTANDPIEVAELKRQAFWNLYITDKNHCLNLGRRSNFADDDIDQDIFPVSDDPRQAPLDQFNNIFIKYAMIQGRAYDELYSLKAERRSPADRKATVDQLARQMLDVVENDFKTLDISKSWFQGEMSGMVKASDAMAWTTLTTIYRAQTNPTTSTEISSECFAYARMALDAHVRFAADFVTEELYQQKSYVTWVLLYSSFTPFIIHFTWTVSTLDPGDLNLLEQVVAMLHRFKDISKGAERLYNVCNAFGETAKVLVQSQHSLSGIQQHDDGSLMFTDAMAHPAPTNADWNAWSQMFPAVDSNADMSMFLNNWLSDGRPVLDMLGLNDFEQSRSNK